MIPAFNGEGVLPPGRYSTDAVEIEQHLVLPFPTSTTRANLYNGLRTRREELLDLMDVEAEWIDGSFVTAKRDPGDVDVVSYLDAASFDALELPDRQRVFELTGGTGGGPHALLAFGCDCYPVMVFPEAHRWHVVYLNYRGYWDRWWSMHQGTPDAKGYLELRGRE